MSQFLQGLVLAILVLLVHVDHRLPLDEVDRGVVVNGEDAELVGLGGVVVLVDLADSVMTRGEGAEGAVEVRGRGEA